MPYKVKKIITKYNRLLNSIDDSLITNIEQKSVTKLIKKQINDGTGWDIESYYVNQRDVLLFFYYPPEEYISYLMTVDELEFQDEITCDDLFKGSDPRERILIFSLG